MAAEFDPVATRFIERVARRALIAEKEKEARFVEDWIATIPGT